MTTGKEIIGEPLVIDGRTLSLSLPSGPAT